MGKHNTHLSVGLQQISRVGISRNPLPVQNQIHVSLGPRTALFAAASTTASVTTVRISTLPILTIISCTY